MKENKYLSIADDRKCGSGCFFLWVLFAICVFLIIVNDEDIIRYTDAHPGMASWVQAVGSIIALCATAYIARMDGLHRKNEAIRRDRAEIREIKFHLFKTSFWHAFGTYNLIYKNFSTYEGKNSDIKEYNVLFVLLNTVRHFDHLYDQIGRMSDEDKYILQLSDVGEDFSTLVSTLSMINNRYEVFVNIATESLNYEKGVSFSKLVKSNGAQNLKWENDNLRDVKETLDGTLVIISAIYSNISRRLYSNRVHL